MFSTRTVAVATLSVLILVAAAVSSREVSAPNAHWPQFRGERARGVATDVDLPLRWNVEKGENVRWKTPIEGLSHASPIVWSDRVYVLTAISKDAAELKVGLYGDIAPANDKGEQTWKLYGVNKSDGDIVWERVVHRAVPDVLRHTKATHANSTPATDGKRIVTFAGSEGLFAFDMQGEPLWQKDLGKLDSGYYRFPQMQWGFASSPVLHDDRVLVQCDTNSGCFVAAFDAASGEEIWRTERLDAPTWSTPTLYEVDGATRFAVNGYKQIAGYDFKTGNEIWTMEGGGDIPVPTPIVGDEFLYVTSAHGGPAPLFAIRKSARGDISLEGNETSNEAIAWSTRRNGAYMQTPILWNDNLYSCGDSGVLKCYDASTGEVHYRKRLGGGQSGFTASPVAGDDKIFFTSEQGDVHVVKPGDRFELLATNPLGEICMATPAISEGRLLFRTRGHLVAIGK